MTQIINAWSYSRYNTYRQCPGKAKLLYIEKLKEPESAALANGQKRHTEMEYFLKGYAPLPDWVHKNSVEYCNQLKSEKPHAELSVAFDKDWNPVEWFAKNAWARIKIDALVRHPTSARVVDWKTGKIRDGEYDEQLELYALTAFLMFPDVEEVGTELCFMELGVLLPVTVFKREDMEMLRARWEQRVGVMLNDEVFEYTPNQFCSYCSFRKENGGPCTI